MKITAKTKICMIIGDPVEYSLSPQIHNAGYEALGIDGEYIYVASHTKKDELENFIKGVRAMQIRGIAVKTPHKTAVMEYLDEIDAVAKQIGAVNTIVNDDGKLKGYNTDWIGVTKPLEIISPIKNKMTALIGAGGAARAAAYGITIKGSKLTIFNRTLSGAQELANEFGGAAKSLEDLEEIKNMDIIINATSVGHPPHENETPVPSDYIKSTHIVYDIVYGSNAPTKLIAEASKKGAKTITGIEMLLHQGFAQFKLFTGHDAPEEAMRNVLLQNVK